MMRVLIVGAAMMLAGSLGAAYRSGSSGGGPVEQEVSFAAGAHTVHGSLLLPAGATGRRLPAALIIAGSGPTDRNGNTPLLPGETNTLRELAGALADAGVASLRYDKLGTGATGLAGIDLTQITFDAFLDEAQAALDILRARPEVDPDRVLILGHSEGSLVALVLAAARGEAADLRALVLAAPAGSRYLDVARRQIAEQFAAAVAAGLVTEGQATAVLAEMDQITAGLRATGNLPEQAINPVLAPLFPPYIARFLSQADSYDPTTLAAELPSLPALILRGDKDQQSAAIDVATLVAAFTRGGNTGVTAFELADVNHVFKVVPGEPNPETDYTNPALPFSPEAAERLTEFVRRLFP